MLDGAAQELIKFLKTNDPATAEPRLTRWFSLREEFPDVFHRLMTSPVDTKVDFTVESRHFPLFLAGRTFRAGRIALRVVSPLLSLAGAVLAVGPKVVDPAQQRFKEVVAPALPTYEGATMKAFDFENVPQGPEVQGIAGAIVGDHVIKLKVAGPLASDLPGGNAGAIDPSKLQDIILQVAYGLA